LNRELRSQRNAYEVVFPGLFDALDLPEGVDRVQLRLQLLGALNWVPIWYDAGKDKNAEKIARTLVATIRAGLDP
jgi:hypothetical protein